MIETTPLFEVIEKHIDRIGLPQMFELIAIICEEKADHLCVNWQDPVSAGAWKRIARELDALAAKAKARGIK